MGCHSLLRSCWQCSCLKWKTWLNQRFKLHACVRRYRYTDNTMLLYFVGGAWLSEYMFITSLRRNSMRVNKLPRLFSFWSFSLALVSYFCGLCSQAGGEGQGWRLGTSLGHEGRGEMEDSCLYGTWGQFHRQSLEHHLNSCTALNHMSWVGDLTYMRWTPPPILLKHMLQ